MHTDWLRRFQHKQVLAKVFERDLVGLTRYTVALGAVAVYIDRKTGQKIETDF